MPSRRFAIPLALIAAALLIAGALYVTLRPHGPAVSSETVSAMRPVGPDDHILGNPAAPVMLVEYCSTASPFCPSFTSTLEALIGHYGPSGTVALTERSIDDSGETNANNLDAIGATGVPFTVVLVSGKKPVTIDGALSYDQMSQVIDAALTSVGKAD